MAGIETPYFHCGPSVQNQIREQGKREKRNMRMKKSKENTLIYAYVYIHTPADNKDPTMWGKFKNFIQIIRTSIYGLFYPFTGR